MKALYTVMGSCILVIAVMIFLLGSFRYSLLDFSPSAAGSSAAAGSQHQCMSGLPWQLDAVSIAPSHGPCEERPLPARDAQEVSCTDRPNAVKNALLLHAAGSRG